MRGPLANIRLQILLMQELKKKIDEEKYETIVVRLDRNYHLLAELVDSLLEESRIRAGRAVIEPTLVDIAQLVRDLTENFRPQAERKGLHLAVADYPEKYVISTDSKAVQVVLRNLLTNAIKFTATGRVDIAMARSGREYRISVRDEGPGIPLGDRERIFEPFQRVQRPDFKHISGFGLGLATAKKLSEALGGGIELETSDLGSTFTLVLPCEDVS
jgi:signal transduction histidine kinase